MQYVLETDALSKRYRGFAALDGLNMHIPKGAIYGFVGRNGAGKTTLIRLICGLQAPSGGSYTLCGVQNTDPAILRCRRRMGAVVETPSVYLDMTAEENIRQQYRVLGVPRRSALHPHPFSGADKLDPYITGGIHHEYPLFFGRAAHRHAAAVYGCVRHDGRACHGRHARPDGGADRAAHGRACVHAETRIRIRRNEADHRCRAEAPDARRREKRRQQRLENRV